MKHRCAAALVGAALLAVVIPGGAAAATSAPRAKAPAWMSKTIRDRIMRAGATGVSFATIRKWVRAGAAGKSAKDEPVPDPCLGVQPSSKLQANTCETYPYGCTANFIYHYGPGPVGDTSDGRNYFIGTAGHCVDHANQPVFMEIGATMVNVGVVYKLFHGDIGNDFSAIRIRQGIEVEPRTPIGGPQGIYTGCDPTDVEYYGHGYGVFVGQGKAEGGLATNWFDRSVGWAGVAAPGDSGSGVVIESSGEAAAILTHLVVDLRRYPGSDTAGTRVTRALTFLGANFYLVNEDYTTSRATMADTRCGNDDAGGGGLL